MNWNNFKYLLTDVFNKHAPPKEKMCRGKPAPWLTLELKMKMNERDFYFKKARVTNKDSDWLLFRRSRNNITHAVRQAKSMYCRNLLQENTYQPKDFWNSIKKVFPTKAKSQSLPNLMNVDGEKVSDKQLIANSFCEFFSTIGCKLQSKISALGNRIWRAYSHTNMQRLNVQTIFHFSPVSRAKIISLLKTLKSNKATGPDNIPASMIKDAKEELSVPLCILANQSLDTGLFPTSEKTAKVTPIYKASGERSDFDNYRPISVLNVLSKVLEKIVYQQLVDYLEENNLLYQNQYGFRKNKCTQDAVLHLHDHIRNNMNKKNCTGALYIDLRKAFDTVSHSCLLTKLPYYGISGNELNWISSYLFNRQQYISYNQTKSEMHSVTLGVPQGSILGPLLFVVLINDAYQCLQDCQMLMYADDTVLFFSHSSTKTIEEKLSHEGTKLFNWFADNNLVLNLKSGKTELVIYGTSQKLKTQPPCSLEILHSSINCVTNYEYLGITLDQTLSLSNQTKKLFKRINQRLNLLRRVRSQLTSNAANNIYRSMIEPIMLYCAPIYAGVQTFHTKSIQVERKASKIVDKSENISNKIKQRTVIEVFKYLRGIKSANQSSIDFKPFEHNINTRGNGNRLIVPQTKNESGRKAFSVQGALLFNRIPQSDRKELSILKFKKSISKFNF